MRVLVVDASSGQAHGTLGAVRALAAAGHEVDLAHASPTSVAARSRHVARTIPVPPADEAGFATAVQALLGTGEYGACFPTSDLALVALDWPGADLVDKAWLRDRLEAVGAPRASSREFASWEDLQRAADDLTYPLALKPAVGGPDAIDVTRADSPEDLGVAEDVTEALVAETWLVGEQRAVSGVVHQGRLLAVAHQRYVRTWPVQCGVACAAVTTEPDLEVERHLVAVLAGYDGIFQCQLIDGRIHDINPRVYGSVLLAHEAGVNLPAVAARLAVEGPPPPGEPLRARPGVRYRWLEGDLRHLATSLRAGEMRPAEAFDILRPRRGTVRSDLWISDLAPTLARLRFVAGRLWSAP